MTKPSRPKIFYIGFNKTGTVSLHEMMKASGILSAHWATSTSKVILAQKIVSNKMASLPILSGIDEFEAYSDFYTSRGGTYLEANRFFKDFAAEYPDAYFVLNIRGKEGWLRSRSKHYMMLNRGLLPKKKSIMIQQNAEALNVDPENMTNIWSRIFDIHVKEVREFFADGRHNFLEFNIESDDVSTLAEFLKPDYDLNVDAWGHFNTAKSRDIRFSWRRKLFRLKA